MAEAFLNKISGGRHRGTSAGSIPSDEVNPIAVKAMAELGIDMGGARPKMLTAEMVEAADIVITMGCGENVCPVVPVEMEDWELDDPYGQPLEVVRGIRDEIRGRVEALVENLDSRA